MDAGGEDDRANGCAVVQPRLSKGVALRRRFGFARIRSSRRRKAFGVVRLHRSHRRCPKAAPVTKVSLWPLERPDSFLSNWSSARRCLRMQKNVRGGIASSSSALPAAQRRGGSASTRQLEPLAARQVHQSWRKRIAAPRLEIGFDQRELHRVPSAPHHFL